jgi:hypothetical protein
MHGLEDIFSPEVISKMTDEEILKMIKEPATTGRKREVLEDRISKLEEGQRILRNMIHVC